MTAGYLPRQHKTHIFSKSSVFAAEGCKFSISGFPQPLREITFSDFSLPKGVPVKCSGRTTRQQGNHTPSRALRHGGGYSICVDLILDSQEMIVFKTPKRHKKSAAEGDRLLRPFVRLLYNHFLRVQNKIYTY